MAVEREGARRRLPPEMRRAEILDAALEVFAELGFERATLQDVADRVGVTKGALYHYFESKNQLFIELVRARLADLVVASDVRIAAADPATTREEILREHLGRIWETLQQPHMLELSRLIMVEIPKFPEIGKAFFEEVVLPSRRTMRRIWERGGSFPADDTRVDALIAALPSVLFGVALTQRMFAGIDPLGVEPETLGSSLIDALVHGAFTDPQQYGGKR